MVKDLIVNSSLLISWFFVGNLLLTWLRRRLSSIRAQSYIYSFGFALIGMVLMMFSVHRGPANIDFRVIAIALSAYYGGLLPSLLTSTIIGIFRTVLFGVNLQSFEIFCVTVSVGFLCGIIPKFVMNRGRQWALMILLATSAGTLSVVVLLQSWTDIRNVFPSYWLGNIVTGCIAYFVAQYLRQSNRSLSQLEWLSTRDFLTELNNARQFDLTINDMFTRSQATQGEFALLILDIDHFKKINDEYGHPAGDMVLRDLARLLCEVIRIDDQIFRNGGEEFTVLLPNCTYEMAFDIAERIRDAVHRHRFVLSSGTVVHLTVSIGLANYPHMASDLTVLVETADQGLYMAKRAGRNQIGVAVGCSVVGYTI